MRVILQLEDVSEQAEVRVAAVCASRDAARQWLDANGIVAVPLEEPELAQVLFVCPAATTYFMKRDRAELYEWDEASGDESESEELPYYEGHEMLFAIVNVGS